MLDIVAGKATETQVNWFEAQPLTGLKALTGCTAIESRSAGPRRGLEQTRAFELRKKGVYDVIRGL
jgi:hypothetical protein